MGDRIVWCKHHEQPEPMVHRCKAGVDIDSLVSPGTLGRHYILPCNSDDHPEGAPQCKRLDCAWAEWPTPEEIAAEDAETERFAQECVERLQKTLPMIGRIKKGTALQGREDCPVCDGTVEWAVASGNKHIRMRCSTEDCINFME